MRLHVVLTWARACAHAGAPPACPPLTPSLRPRRRYMWLTELANEGSAFVYYAWVGFAFRPHNDSKYLRVTDEDIELATSYQ